MTREQQLEAALRRIEDLALDDMLDLVGDIAREAIELPPDTDTRVVSVEMLGLMIRSLNSIPGSEYYHDDTIHKVANALRAIIEGKDRE